MNISKLRHRITIQTPKGVAYNAVGEEVPVYEDFATVWASVDPITRRNFSNEGKVDMVTYHQIGIRYLPGLDEDMTILFKGRIFEIKSIVNVEERNKEINLICFEKVTV